MRDFSQNEFIPVGTKVIIQKKDGLRATGKFIRHFTDEDTGKTRSSIQIGPTKSDRDIATGTFIAYAPD